MSMGANYSVEVAEADWVNQMDQRFGYLFEKDEDIFDKLLRWNEMSINNPSDPDIDYI